MVAALIEEDKGSKYFKNKWTGNHFLGVKMCDLLSENQPFSQNSLFCYKIVLEKLGKNTCATKKITHVSMASCCVLKQSSNH